MNKIPDKRRFLALSILKDLLRCLKSVHADIFYVALAEKGFDEGERSRLIGSSIRIASSRGWMKRTSLCLKSRRNHSNLQSVWISCLFPAFSKSGLDAENKILAAYDYWRSNKMEPPDDLLEMWQKIGSSHM
jgi:hypothetical protein